MAIQASAIISRVRTQLIDTNPSSQHWTDAELLLWLSDGQRTIVTISPSTAATRYPMPLAVGTKQTLPGDAHLLLDIERNIVGGQPGRAIRKADEATLDAFNPDWHTAPQASLVKHYLYNPTMQQDFYVYPPNDGTGVAEVIYAKLPADLTALTDVLVVQPVYQTALFDYVMYRAHQKDSDFAAGNSVAMGYFQAFQSVVGTGEGSEAAQQPNASGAS